MDGINENVLKRVMPHDDDSERAVITSMLLKNDKIESVHEIIKNGDEFYNKAYGIIFDVIIEMSNAGKSVDPVTLANTLSEKNVPGDIAQVSYIIGITSESSSSTSANATYYATYVHNKYIKRQLIEAAEKIATKGYEDPEDLNALFDEAEKNILTVTDAGISKEITPTEDIFSEALINIHKANQSQGDVTGVDTGFDDLNFMTGGFQNSDLILIAARPSMGKTALALNIAENMVLKKNKCVGIFSLEMSSTQLATRMLGMNTRIDIKKLRGGGLNTDDFEKLIASGTNLGHSGLFIDDTPGLTVAEVKAKCRRYKKKGMLDIIFIDYLQLMQGSGKAESRQQEVSQISRDLKGLARELNIPVVALSQLSRTVESRKPPKPMLSDLRESGAIEQDADLVMFIYREDYYNKDTKRKNVSDIIIAKQRNGATGDIHLVWLPEYTKFANMSKEDKERLKAEEPEE